MRCRCALRQTCPHRSVTEEGLPQLIPHQQQAQAQAARDALENASTRIWCGNIASHVTSRTLKAVFGQYGCARPAPLHDAGSSCRSGGRVLPSLAGAQQAPLQQTSALTDQARQHLAPAPVVCPVGARQPCAACAAGTC